MYGITFLNYNRIVTYKLSFLGYWYYFRENQLIKADSNAHHDVRKSKFSQRFDKNLYFIDCNLKFRRHINSLWIDVFSPLISRLYSHKVADLVVKFGHFGKGLPYQKSSFWVKLCHIAYSENDMKWHAI